MLLRIWQLIVKEFIHFRRDRILALFLIVFPLLQLVLIVRATAGDVGNLPLAVLDRDGSPVSRGIIRSLDNTEELAVSFYPANEEEIRQLLDLGQATVAVVIPPNFAADLSANGTPPVVQIIVDGSNISAGTSGLVAAEGAVISHLQRELNNMNLSYLARAGGASPVELRTAVRFNPELDQQYSSIPGLFAFVIYQVAMVVAALGLVREHELGTMEQLTVTPIRRFELLIGKAVPAIVISIFEFAVMLVVIVELFDIPMRGSWVLLLLLSTLFVTTVTTWGMLISVLVRTQQQATLVVFPLVMIDLSLSGYLVPVESMGAGMRLLSNFSPLRHYMAILRDVLLKGADLSTLWPNAVALLGLTAAVAYLNHRYVGRRFD